MNPEESELREVIEWHYSRVRAIRRRIREIRRQRRAGGTDVQPPLAPMRLTADERNVIGRD